MLVFFRNSPKLWMLGNKLGQKGGRWWGAEGGDGGQKGGGGRECCKAMLDVPEMPPSKQILCTRSSQQGGKQVRLFKAF